MKRIHLMPLLLAGTAVPALAAEAPQEALITVTGRGLADRPGDAAASVITIERDRILQTGSNRLESVLADIAGQQQFRRSDSRSANATSQGITLRGLGGNASSRALLILDGVPQADPFGGWVAFPAYATGRLGRIRVTRGGGSGYWGAGALAGTIEIDSVGPADLVPVDAFVAYGSRNSLDAQGGLALVRDGGFATLAAAYGRGDGFVPLVARSRGPVDRPAPYEQASGALRAVLEIAADTELQFNASAFTDNRERGTPFSENHSDGLDGSIRLVGRGRWGWQLLGYVQNRNFTSDFVAIDPTRTTATPTLRQFDTPATGIGGRIEIAPPVGEGISLRLGGETRQLAGHTNEYFTYVAGLPTRLRRAGGETGTNGLFADGSAEAGPLTLTAGGRIDWWQIRDGRLTESVLATGAGLNDLRYADRSGSEWSGRVGAAVRASDWLTLRAAGYRGWRLPTLNELYRPFRVGADATAANAQLSPEQLTGVDAGLTLASGGLRLDATLFWNRMAGAIANVTAGAGPGVFPQVGFVAAGGIYRTRQNLDAIRSRGFEIDASWTQGPFAARASWSRVDPRVEASGAAVALDGRRPAQTPLDTLSATLEYNRQGWTASTTLRHFARQFEDDQNSRVLAPATTVDALLALPLGAGLTLEGRAENLFDHEVQAQISGPGGSWIERALPRTLWIGLRYRMR